jgi:hypothetical protein
MADWLYVLIIAAAAVAIVVAWRAGALGGAGVLTILLTFLVLFRLVGLR